MGVEHGAAKVLGDAVGAASAALEKKSEAARGEQLPMFVVPTRFTGPRGEQVQRALEHQRRAGRPPGARNKSTEELKRYFLARGADPLQRLVEWGLHSPTSLAAELGCTRLEAFDRLVELWGEAAPFFYGKAVPVDGDGNAVPFFQMNFGGASSPGQALPPWLYEGGPAPMKTLQNQPLETPADPVSHGDKSHGEPK